MTKPYDVVIIGGGIAGCSAALYAARRELKTLVISKDIGGQLATARTVENYPGVESAEGPELSMRYKKHAERFGAKFVFDTVDTVSKSGEDFLVKAQLKSYKTRSVILAFGKTPRHLSIPGEREFAGKGVSYCAICDGPLFKDKIVAVIGGGNTAVDAAEYLGSIAKRVYLIHRRKEFRAEPQALKRVFSDNKIEVIKDSIVKEIRGSRFVEKITIENLKSRDREEIKVDGVFVEIGYEVKADFVKKLVDLNNLGEIKTTLKGETKTKGVFAAGDLTPIPYKQAVVAAASGVVAALAAYDFLSCKRKVGSTNWECSK